MEIKMIWDTIFIGDYENRKKIWTYKNWIFTVMRDPSKHTLVKMNAYWFNVDVLKQIIKKDENAILIVNQRWTSIKLKIAVGELLRIWTYKVFKGEKQVFLNKNSFGVCL